MLSFTCELVRRPGKARITEGSKAVCAMRACRATSAISVRPRCGEATGLCLDLSDATAGHTGTTAARLEGRVGDIPGAELQASRAPLLHARGAAERVSGDVCVARV